jgi:hypothetical protein
VDGGSAPLRKKGGRGRCLPWREGPMLLGERIGEERADRRRRRRRVWPCHYVREDKVEEGKG